MDPTDEVLFKGTSRSIGLQTYHSPLIAPSFFESWLMPAAAEAKLEGSGKGIFPAED